MKKQMPPSEDLLSVTDLDADAHEKLALRAIELAGHWRNRTMPQTLAGARIGSIVELPGWRNPTALAHGVQAMGGSCLTVSAKLEGAEAIEDLAGYLDNWFDLMAVRTPRLQRLMGFADELNAPVVNLRTNDNHPCEIIGDLAYVLSQRGSWDGLRVAMVGPRGNIINSWVEASAVLPIKLVHVAPASLALDSAHIGQKIEVTDDLEAVKDAHVVVTDCWPSKVSDVERVDLARHRIDAALLSSSRSDVMFIPCPPVTRGEEITADAMQHARCVAAPAKAFLLHAQNAIVERAIAAR